MGVGGLSSWHFNHHNPQYTHTHAHTHTHTDLQPFGLRLIPCDSLNIWLRPGTKVNAPHKNVFTGWEREREHTEGKREREGELYPRLCVLAISVIYVDQMFIVRVWRICWLDKSFFFFGRSIGRNEQFEDVIVDVGMRLHCFLKQIKRFIELSRLTKTEEWMKIISSCSLMSVPL